MMDQDHNQVSSASPIEIGETQDARHNAASLMKDPTFTLVELSREEMERVAAARSYSKIEFE